MVIFVPTCWRKQSIFIISDLVSEYLQYQEATAEDDDDEEEEFNDDNENDLEEEDAN